MIYKYVCKKWQIERERERVSKRDSRYTFIHANLEFVSIWKHKCGDHRSTVSVYSILCRFVNSITVRSEAMYSVHTHTGHSPMLTFQYPFSQNEAMIRDNQTMTERERESERKSESGQFAHNSIGYNAFNIKTHCLLPLIVG